MNDIFTNIKADFDAFVGSANDVINKTKGETMNAPTEKQQALWKTYMSIVENLDNNFGDEHHELHQQDAIRQVAFITDRTFDDVRNDILVVCEWLKLTIGVKGK